MEIRNGPIADIRVASDFQVLPGLQGSFREFVLFMNDRNPFTASSFNLRAEPLRADTDRGRGPPELALSSVMSGDSRTPLLQAYGGDPIMFRLLISATEEVHPFHITGHRFRWERLQEDSPERTVVGVGISERFNAYIDSAGGPGQSGAKRVTICTTTGPSAISVRVAGAYCAFLTPSPKVFSRCPAANRLREPASRNLYPTAKGRPRRFRRASRAPRMLRRSSLRFRRFTTRWCSTNPRV